jgi:hypothetical protein
LCINPSPRRLCDKRSLTSREGPMTPVPDQKLYDAMVLALEGLSFLLVDEDMVEGLPPEDGLTRAQIQFEGPLKGRLSVIVGAELLETISANMLGEDMAPGATAQFDAFGEVANVVAGNYLPMVGGEDAVFHISPPRVGVYEAAGEQEGPADAHVCAQFMEGSASALVHWETAPGVAEVAA